MGIYGQKMMCFFVTCVTLGFKFLIYADAANDRFFTHKGYDHYVCAYRIQVQM